MFEDGSIFNQLLVERINYFIYIVLLLIGLWAMIAKNNLIKKLIGMSIFQTAIILFYVSIGVKEGSTIPIYLPEHDPHGDHLISETNGSLVVNSPEVLDASMVANYTNPLPHVLMLTAIVVGVATLGLALSVCLRIYRGYGTVEEDELLEKLEREDARKFGSSNRPRTRRKKPRQKTSGKVELKKGASQDKLTSSKTKRKPDGTYAKNPNPETSNKNDQSGGKNTGKSRRVRKPRKSRPRKPEDENS